MKNGNLNNELKKLAYASIINIGKNRLKGFKYSLVPEFNILNNLI
jgi:hypothetical protein